jgi:hypothetical protein
MYKKYKSKKIGPKKCGLVLEYHIKVIEIPCNGISMAVCEDCKRCHTEL